MHLLEDSVHNAVILRPGALGDVLAVRGTIRLVRELFPRTEVSLAAPGERGGLFQRPGWADHVQDWERAAFSWLFTDGAEPPPQVLQTFFSRADLILSYVDFEREGASVFRRNLDRLAPAAAKAFHRSRPRAGEGVPIGEWLASAALRFCVAHGLKTRDREPDLPALAASRIVAAGSPSFAVNDGGYAVIHPGSGSVSKNWPLDCFLGLGRLVLESGWAMRILVISGEADGDLGERLAASLPGSEHVRSPRLEILAQILAHAFLYIGNDSGVSHLAAAVRTDGGRHPRVVTVFGPSDPAVWAPPGALVLRAGRDMSSLTDRDACKEIRRAIRL